MSDRPTAPEAAVPGGLRAQLRAVVTVLGLAYRAAPRNFILLFVAAAFGSLTALLTQTYALKLLTDGALAGSTARVLAAIALITAGFANGMIVGRLHLNTAVKVTERTQHRIDQQLISFTGRPPGIEHHESPHHADQLSLLRERRALIGQLPNALAFNFSIFLPLIGGSLLLASIHPALLLLPLALAPAGWLDSRAVTVDEQARERTTELRRERQHLFDRATATDSAAELRLFGLADELIRRQQHVSDRINRTTDRANLRSSALRVAAAAIFASGFVATVGFVMLLAIDGKATPGEVVLAVTLARVMNGVMMGVVGIGIYTKHTAKQASRYLWLQDYARDAIRQATPAVAAPLPTSLTDGVTFEGASFSYPGTDAQILSDLSFRLPAGAVVALVGENGAGKTTLVKLLARFYEPSTGHILVDGAELTSFDAHDWQQSVSITPQDFSRFEFLARETVAVGHLPRIDDSASAHQAIQRAGATGVLNSLPQELDTQLGKTWPDGVDLSGGEWQQLALSRAFMRPAPLLVIFDEPTAAIDAPTEHALFERLATEARSQAGRGAITLIVSHRFSTVRMADLIVVLDQGHVREIGTHAELMQRRDLYAELYSLQARAYR